MFTNPFHRPFEAPLASPMKGRSWWNSAAYYANDNADGVAKLPGYIADFRKGQYAKPALGSELFVAGSTVEFSTAPSASTESPAGQLNLTSDGTNSARRRWSFPTTVGSAYKISVNAIGSGANIFVGTTIGGAQNLNGAVIASLTTSVFYFIATAAITHVYIGGVFSGTRSFNEITNREVTGLSSAVFSDLFRFTRAGQATYIDAAGNLQTAANDAPRFDYSNGKRQLLLEGGSTNLAPRSVCIKGTGWVETGAIATNLTGNYLGVFPGVRVSSAGADWHRLRMDGALVLSVTSGSLYSGTAFVCAGTSGRVRVVMRDTITLTESRLSGVLGGTLSTSNSNGTITLLSQTQIVPGIWKITFNFTPVTSNTHSIDIGPDSATVGHDIIALGAQFEALPFATSYIATSGSAVTRAPDSCRFTEDHRALIALTAASALVQAEGLANMTVGVTNMNWIGSTGGFNRLLGSNVPSNNYVLSASDTVAVGPLNNPTIAFGVIGAWSASGKAISANGSVVNSNGTPIDTAVTDMYLGRASGGNYSYGGYDQLVTYPFRVANANLPGKAVPYAA